MALAIFLFQLSVSNGLKSEVWNLQHRKPLWRCFEALNWEVAQSPGKGGESSWLNQSQTRGTGPTGTQEPGASKMGSMLLHWWNWAKQKPLVLRIMGGGGEPVICPHLSMYFWIIWRAIQTSSNCTNIFYLLNRDESKWLFTVNHLSLNPSLQKKIVTVFLTTSAFTYTTQIHSVLG